MASWGMRIEELKAADLDRIREIDRSESVRFKYVYEHGELLSVEINHEIPTWTDAMVVEAKEMLAPKLAAGGALLGAFAGDTLVGVAVLGGELIGVEANQLQMAFLYVSNGYRRRGIANALMDEVCLRARQKGAKQLYISATETESALGFYFRYGCRLAESVEPALYELEPADIHLTLDLCRDQSM
jgi:ribosomal protein S18 acetylase RimI-like enzyme